LTRCERREPINQAEIIQTVTFRTIEKYKSMAPWVVQTDEEKDAPKKDSSHRDDSGKWNPKPAS